MEELNQKSTYIIQLDGLRFFAILLVMIAHWLQWQIDNPVINGFPFAHGVILFFVLSGFLITNILLQNKAKYENGTNAKSSLIKSFYIRRIIRIFPIYYLTIFFLLTISYKNTNELLPWLLSYSSNIYQSVHNVYVGDFNHFWSLAVEEQFYLFWPWLMVFIPIKHIEKLIILFIIISIISKIYIFFYINSWMANSYFTLSCMHALGLGSLFAYWAIYRKNLIQFLLKFYWIIIATCIYFLFHYFSFASKLSWGLETIDDFFFAIMSAFIINYASENKFKTVFKYILENKFIVYSGKISYGLYVYHLFIPPLFWYLAPKIGLSITNKYTAFIAFYFITFLLAHISWKLIESPINSFKKFFPYYKKLTRNNLSIE